MVIDCILLLLLKREICTATYMNFCVPVKLMPPLSEECFLDFCEFNDLIS